MDSLLEMSSPEYSQMKSPFLKVLLVNTPRPFPSTSFFYRIDQVLINLQSYRAMFILQLHTTMSSSSFMLKCTFFYTKENT